MGGFELLAVSPFRAAAMITLEVSIELIPEVLVILGSNQ